MKLNHCFKKKTKILIIGAKEPNDKLVIRFINGLDTSNIICLGDNDKMNLNIYTYAKLKGFTIINSNHYKTGLWKNHSWPSYYDDYNNPDYYKLYYEFLPSKIYILDDNYDSNIERYKFTECLDINKVDVIVIKYNSR